MAFKRSAVRSRSAPPRSLRIFEARIAWGHETKGFGSRFPRRGDAATRELRHYGRELCQERRARTGQGKEEPQGAHRGQAVICASLGRRRPRDLPLRLRPPESRRARACRERSPREPPADSLHVFAGPIAPVLPEQIFIRFELGGDPGEVRAQHLRHEEIAPPPSCPRGFRRRVSNIERGLVHPTVHVPKMLAKHLGVLLRDLSAPPALLRGEAHRPRPQPGSSAPAGPFRQAVWAPPRAFPYTNADSGSRFIIRIRLKAAPAKKA